MAGADQSAAPYHPGLSGLEVLQGVLDGRLPSVSGLHETLNVRLMSVGDGMARFEGTPGDAHRNPHGTIHGGWSMSVLDGAIGLAVFSKQSAEQLSSTVTFECKIIRPLVPDRQYAADARVIHSGRTTAHGEATLTDLETGKIMASATSTYAIFARPQA